MFKEKIYLDISLGHLLFGKQMQKSALFWAKGGLGGGLAKEVVKLGGDCCAVGGGVIVVGGVRQGSDFTVSTSGQFLC